MVEDLRAFDLDWLGDGDGLSPVLAECFGARVDDGFWLRFKFYRFWDDVKHFVRMGWYE